MNTNLKVRDPVHDGIHLHTLRGMMMIILHGLEQDLQLMMMMKMIVRIVDVIDNRHRLHQGGVNKHKIAVLRVIIRSVSHTPLFLSETKRLGGHIYIGVLFAL